MTYLSDVLLSNGAARDRVSQMDLYAFLVGRWTFDATVHLTGGGVHRGRGEIHADWVLEGRAIQDVWILPEIFYGTTLRVYAPQEEAWRIIWSDPLRQYYSRQWGRARGADIVQEGTDESGTRVRWSFNERRDDSFLWLGESSTDGSSWALKAEFRARRVADP